MNNTLNTQNMNNIQILRCIPHAPTDSCQCYNEAYPTTNNQKYVMDNFNSKRHYTEHTLKWTTAICDTWNVKIIHHQYLNIKLK